METRVPATQTSPPSYPRPPRIVVAMAAVAGVAAVVVAIVIGARVLAGAAQGDTGSPAAIEAGLPVSLDIPEGASARTISRMLETAGVVSSAADFEHEVRVRDVAEQLRAGSYDLETAMDPDELFAALLSGPPAAETYRVTVIEGLRIEEIVASLAEQTPHSAAELTAPLMDGTVQSPLLPPGLVAEVGLTAWEGLLFPDTYDFTVDASPSSVLQRLADTMVRRVDAIDWGRLPELGISRYEAVIVASLIEKEAKLDRDRPLIASVIYNRLAVDMPLQVDATIIYALGGNPGRVLFEDLEIESPYNTYLYGGLPPTPISGARFSSLEAAATPAETDFLYYLLVAPDGSHGFTASYDEFLAMKAKAQQDGVLP